MLYVSENQNRSTVFNLYTNKNQNSCENFSNLSYVNNTFDSYLYINSIFNVFKLYKVIRDHRF